MDVVSGAVAARLRSLRSDDPLSKGHPRSIKQELETLKTFKHTYELLNLGFYPFKYPMHHVLINLYLGYVVGTYPPSIHTCNSCRRYVVVTYRPIMFIPCTKHLPDTCNFGKLILIGTE